ncbi:MAG: nucleotide exchange factor GrpE [Acidimicrobiales bacterium]|nr:nucleotide exchange factor GrpE [Actinomycetota bacterium]
MSDAHEPSGHHPGADDVEDPLGPPAEDDGLDPSDADAAPGGDLPPEPAGEGGGAPSDGDAEPDRSASSVEELIMDLEQTAAERDEYLDALLRNQADFENYRKRVAKQTADDAARATEALVEQLLPVLDACDGAISHGASEVEPIYAALLGTLEKVGLVRMDPVGEEFDPNHHEAVLHEPAYDGEEETMVSDVLRPGYTWKGRVVRPAMVKVRG